MSGHGTDTLWPLRYVTIRFGHCEREIFPSPPTNSCRPKKQLPEKALITAICQRKKMPIRTWAKIKISTQNGGEHVDIMSLAITRALWTLCSSYVTQNYIYRGADKSLDQPRIMSGTRAISTKLRRELSASLFSARQGTEGNSRHSDRNISLFPSWSG